MTVTGVVSTGTQDAINALIASVAAQIEASNTATMTVASAILPPGMETASLTAQLQELGNVAHYESMLKLGLVEMAKANVLVGVNNHAQQMVDAAGALAASTVAV